MENKHFTKIGVKNFRIFKEKVEFDIKPITVFTGPNNSGKSTLNKLIAFITSAFNFYYIKEIGIVILKDIEYLTLEDNTINEIGTFKSYLNKNSDSDTFSLSFSFNDDKIKIEKTVLLSYQIVNDKKAKLIKIELFFNKEPVLYLFTDHITNLNIDNLLIEYTSEDMGETTNSLKSLEKFRKTDRYVWVYKYHKSFAETLRKVLISKDNLSKPDNLINPLILYSYFSSAILNDNDLFKNSETNKNIGYYKQFLQNNNILSRQDFIKKYIDFEQKLIEQIYENEFGISTKIVRMNEEELEKNYPSWYFRKLKRIAIDEGKINKIFKEKSLPTEEVHQRLKEHIKLKKDFYSILNRININKKIGIDYENISEQSKNSIIRMIKNIDNPLSKLFINELETNDVEDLFNLNNFNNFYKAVVEEVTKSFFTSFSSKIVSHIAGSYKIFSQKKTIPDIFLLNNKKAYIPYLFNFGRAIALGVNKKRDDFINKWIKKFQIGDELQIHPAKVNNQIVGFSFYILKGSELSLLSEEGLGIQKIVNIIIFLEMNDSNLQYLLIEEPESNLHPSFQSKLAELFTEGIVDRRFDRQINPPIIIETHSEYLIRKIQNLIASKESNLTYNDVSIYYLHNPENIPEGKDQIYKLDIREDGFMNNDFGKGFFDEASTLSLGLLNLKNFN